MWKLYKGGRRRIGHPPAGIGGLSVKAEDFGKSGSLLTLRRDDEALKGYKVVDSMLPGKSSYTFILATVP